MTSRRLMLMKSLVAKRVKQLWNLAATTVRVS